MKNSTHLLLRTPLLPGESLPSYLVRLAKLNGYHPPNMVAQICQERLSQPDIITRPTRAETYARLAELVNLDDKRLFAASAHTFAITILPVSAEPELITLRSDEAVVLLPSAVLRQHMCPETDVQFCPHCLAEASYHRLAWLPQAASVCLVHRCLLIKGCPLCGEKLRIGGVVEGRCGHCGFDLRTSPTISVAGDDLGLLSQQIIQGRLRISPANRVDQAKLPSEPDFILYQIVYGLHRAIRTIQRRWDYLYDPFDVETATSVFPCDKKSEMTPFKSYVLYATTFKALLRWPHGFFEFLNAFKLRDQAEPTETVVNDLGSIYTTWLMNTWKQPEFSFLQTVFEEYLQTNFAIDKHFLSALDISLISKEWQCCQYPTTDGGGFLVGHIGRFCCHCPFFGKTYVLGISTPTSLWAVCKNFITLPELLHIFTCRFNFPGQLHPQNSSFRSSET